MDSNASFAGEVERNVSPDNDFSLRGKLHQVRSDPGRLLASLRARRTCISASSMSGAGGRSQTENLSLTKRLHYRLCYAPASPTQTASWKPVRTRIRLTMGNR